MLQHIRPTFDGPPLVPPASYPLGHARVVRSARRARLLRKRGVVLARLCDTNVATGRQDRYWAWFESDASYASRKMARERKSAAKRSMRAAGWPLRLDWVERLLNNVATEYHTRLKERGYLVEYTPTPLGLDWVDQHRAALAREARMADAEAWGGVPSLPEHWTPEQHRAWLTQGFVVEAAPTTPEARARRESPPIRAWVRVGGFEQLLEGYDATEPFQSPDWNAKQLDDPT